MNADDLKKLRQLEQENARLKKLLAERDREIKVMKEIAAKMVGARNVSRHSLSSAAVIPKSG